MYNPMPNFSLATFDSKANYNSLLGNLGNSSLITIFLFFLVNFPITTISAGSKLGLVAFVDNL